MSTSSTIPSASTMAELKAKLSPPAEGMTRECRVSGLITTVYDVPTSAPPSAPESLPDGSVIVGMVQYADHDAMLSDISQ